MISFIKCFLVIGLIYGTCPTNNIITEKVTCNELGLYFMLPGGFTSLDSSKMDNLSKRGERAVNETFNKETLKGWQSVCFNMQDSFKRTLLMSSITVKEAIDQDGTTDKFIEKSFTDGNNFIVQRFKNRANIEIDEKEAVKQTEITIAGLKVKKNAFTFRNGGRLLFFARYYFFQKNEKLFLLSFTGSPRANDNEEVVNAIESAKKLSL
jgi:hypothetical protein